MPENTRQPRHHLYSFRRCPYAMRARMALLYAGIPVDIEEVNFKNKPAAMLAISPKGTVPVLQCESGTVIDESLDIMLWALEQHDPEGWRNADQAEMKALIAENDGSFKAALDRYKYPTRYPDEDCSSARDRGEGFLTALNTRLTAQPYLCGDHITLADIAIFPFIRQFANTDREWFDSLALKPLQNWLSARLESDLFKTIMEKNRDTLN